MPPESCARTIQDRHSLSPCGPNYCPMERVFLRPELYARISLQQGSYKMLTKMRLLVGLCASMVTTSASAAVVIDQSNLVDPSKGNLLFSPLYQSLSSRGTQQGQGQMVRAGRAGLLTAIELQLVAPVASPLDTFAVSLIHGPLNGGRFIGRLDLPVSAAPSLDQAQAGALLRLDVSAFDYHVVPGQEFTLFTSIQNGISSQYNHGPNLVWGREGEQLDEYGYPTQIGLAYDGGYNRILFGTGVTAETLYDRGFRTFVDVPSVPEPKAWAMLMTGFGLIGAMIRRRRRTTSSLRLTA